MATKKKFTVDSYYQTQNEHWNKWAFDMFADVLGKELFADPEQPLALFDKAIDTLEKGHDAPFISVQKLESDLDAQELTPEQKLFILDWSCRYLNNSSFPEADLSQACELLEKRRNKLKAELQPETPLTLDIRERLKALIEKELAALPETLQSLEPAQRLNIICKLIPYILPKVEAVSHLEGEPLGSW
ncbi:MAG: hypothetical protein R3D58_09795 [Saprospiraceae bacterium]